MEPMPVINEADLRAVLDQIDTAAIAFGVIAEMLRRGAFDSVDAVEAIAEGAAALADISNELGDCIAAAIDEAEAAAAASIIELAEAA